MSERTDEPWLDSQLQRAVGGTTPVFDADAWKQKHGDAYRTLLGRSGGEGPAVSIAGRKVRVVLGSWIGRLAVAAGIAVVVGLLVMDRNGPEPGKPDSSRPLAAQASAAGMMSMKSLRATYEQGGFEALDRQLHDTLDQFGPRSSSVPIRELFSM